MNVIDDHEVNESEKITRFICGAILGIVLSIALIYSFDPSSMGIVVLIVVGSIFCCGILALIHGDRFWYAILGAARH
jgi:hypothetical protein